MATENRWVVKIGSSLLTNDGRGLDREALARWVDDIAGLQRGGMEIVVVSSGAVAEGMSRLGWRKRPDDLPFLQAAAAVGQMGLMEAYGASFRRSGICAAQVLLTHEDFASRQRYMNVHATLRKLAQMRAIPVINENDTVSTREICFGDNDMLAALVANLTAADRLVILTDQRGLFSHDPRMDPGADLIRQASAEDDSLFDIAGSASKWGRGGMLSKVKAARMFALSGGITTIASGRVEGVLGQIRSGMAVGTELRPGQQRLLKHNQWLAGQSITHGTIVLDAEAARAVAQHGRSIRPDGVLHVRGNFDRDQVIQITDPEERALAKGLSNYSAREMNRMVVPRTSMAHLPRSDQSITELVHHANIVLELYKGRL
ncbi:glutamate 5-kinase [Paraburkholderia sp. HC6.4b]|uniref:glutamate 5-kinase n=1 Tax=unclassified Paraburkholderia TaxID=2615204 RepID=UPI001613DB17|nr:MULTISPECIES: glutamate 5-kinase [unclassified Paraburkholderia]MBB5411220.1 glutamate 5-kinase [Paraburkholderia sp. HC6.4b]MBB5453992.1 glutamate 5-kinase [Paraburkholderia sp. Kb1A]